jgi:CVNH domain
MKLAKLVNAIAVFIFVFSITLIGSSLSAVAAPSSYQQTCTDISISANVLSGNCRKINGLFNKTSIALKGIENIDGTLRVLDPNKSANFNLTCEGTAVYADQLSSSCRTRDQRLVSTKTRINGIENIDGVLKYTSSSAA